MDWRIPLPRLRNINPMPAVHNRQPAYYLQDPFKLSESSILIPQELGAIFMLCDGTKTLKSIQTALLSTFGIQASIEDLKDLFVALDEAYLFDNENFKKAYLNALRAYREAPFRRATHADVSYPADPNELKIALQSFEPGAQPQTETESIRGIISPHIDFARGGSTYASAWNSLKPIADDIELAIIFGTDHHGNGEAFTLTRQDYETPFGPLPTYQPGIDIFVDNFGEDLIFSGELRHRNEHSIEFAAVWLHFLRDGNPCPILPILCDHLPVQNNNEILQPGSDPRMQRAISDLSSLADSKNTLVIAAGDLSHVGPVFSGAKITRDSLEALSQTDHALLEPIQAGDATEFHRRILSTSNRTNVCGTAPFVNMLNLLSPTHGELIHYQQCPADSDETSWVSICAMHLY